VGPSLVPDPERAPIIVEFYERVVAGETPTAVFDRLRRIGRILPHRDGRAVDEKAMFEWLRNETYIARLVSKGYQVAVAGDWMPIIDERLFHAAHAAMQRRVVPRRNRIEGFMLKGLITARTARDP
jgi:recombinase